MTHPEKSVSPIPFVASMLGDYGTLYVDRMTPIRFDEVDEDLDPDDGEEWLDGWTLSG